MSGSINCTELMYARLTNPKMKSSPPSCTICAKAKSRCVRLPDQDACDRCTRLRKVCVAKEQGTVKRKSHKVAYVSVSLPLQTLHRQIDSTSGFETVLTRRQKDPAITDIGTEARKPGSSTYFKARPTWRGHTREISSAHLNRHNSS